MPTPKRIISTVPSQTELLADLGLDEEVVGITKFCVHPDTWYKSKTRIGGTKTLDLQKIKALSPDLIIANKEENVKEQILELADNCEVYVSDIKSPKDNLQLIKDLGEATGTRMTALRLATELRQSLESLKAMDEKSAAYLIWKDPYMSVGNDTYIHAMMQHCGLSNCFSEQTRYPTTSIEQLKTINPDLILLSSEPYPFKEKHMEALSKELPDSKIFLVDGEVFSWYGTRLIKKADYLRDLLKQMNQASIA